MKHIHAISTQKTQEPNGKHSILHSRHLPRANPLAHLAFFFRAFAREPLIPLSIAMASTPAIAFAQAQSENYPGFSLPKAAPKGTKVQGPKNGMLIEVLKANSNGLQRTYLRFRKEGDESTLGACLPNPKRLPGKENQAASIRVWFPDGRGEFEERTVTGNPNDSSAIYSYDMLGNGIAAFISESSLFIVDFENRLSTWLTSPGTTERIVEEMGNDALHAKTILHPKYGEGWLFFGKDLGMCFFSLPRQGEKGTSFSVTPQSLDFPEAAREMLTPEERSWIGH